VGSLVVAWAAMVALSASCSGKSSNGSSGTTGKACIPVGDPQQIYCSNDTDCCPGGFCDPATLFCRSSAQCSAISESCSEAHACCSDGECVGGFCVRAQPPTTLTSTTSTTATTTSTTGGSVGSNGNNNSATTIGGQTSGNCSLGGASCLSDAECCSGHCDPTLNGGMACANGGNNNATTGTQGTITQGTTTGGTCLNPGQSCSASTDCCSGQCNGICN
jgi:hypothetical protein